MRKADVGDFGPLGELIARSVTGNLYRFVVPAVAGPSRLVPLASLVDEKEGLTANALRVAAIRGRLRAQKTADGTWMSSKKWVRDYQKSSTSGTRRRSEPGACATPAGSPERPTDRSGHDHAPRTAVHHVRGLNSARV
jgi:hypothetical protein